MAVLTRLLDVASMGGTSSGILTGTAAQRLAAYLLFTRGESGLAVYVCVTVFIRAHKLR